MIKYLLNKRTPREEYTNLKSFINHLKLRVEIVQTYFLNLRLYIHSYKRSKISKIFPFLFLNFLHKSPFCMYTIEDNHSVKQEK